VLYALLVPAVIRRRDGGIGEGGIRKEGLEKVGCEEIILCFKLT
jgi:hypothetical protein